QIYFTSAASSETAFQKKFWNLFLILRWRMNIV
ncbi:unnamed protein product, partial [Larinioides sclopetarius]